MKSKNCYSKIIERLFFAHYKKGASEVEFERHEIEGHASKLRIKLPKNLGDLIYSFRYRASLPKSIAKEAPEGEEWIIRPAGRSKYKFVAIASMPIVPNEMLSETKILDSTPGIVSKYAMSDEQGL